MKKIFLNIEVHQPMRLQTYRFYDMMQNHYYYNDYENEYNIRKIAENSYLPVNRILLDLIHYTKKDFKVSFLFSGVVLDQFELYAPEVVESYKTLLDTGCVELLSGTYSNPFGPLRHRKEYNCQIKLQKEKIKSVFRKKPLTFIGSETKNTGFNQTSPAIQISSGNGKLNDIISSKTYTNYNIDSLPKPGKMIRLLDKIANESDDIIELFIPYNLFGDSQNTNTGIIKFLESFPVEDLTKSDYAFGFPSKTETNFQTGLQTQTPGDVAEKNRKLFYAKCNKMQMDAFEKLYSYSEEIDFCDDPIIIKDWLYLQSCDHFHFMNPSLYDQKESKRIFLPYDSAYFAYINYMNILMDFSDRLERWFFSYDNDQNISFERFDEIDKCSGSSISIS